MDLIFQPGYLLASVNRKTSAFTDWGITSEKNITNYQDALLLNEKESYDKFIPIEVIESEKDVEGTYFIKTRDNIFPVLSYKWSIVYKEEGIVTGKQIGRAHV